MGPSGAHHNRFREGDSIARSKRSRPSKTRDPPCCSSDQVVRTEEWENTQWWVRYFGAREGYLRYIIQLKGAHCSPWFFGEWREGLVTCGPISISEVEKPLGWDSPWRRGSPRGTSLGGSPPAARSSARRRRQRRTFTSRSSLLDLILQIYLVSFSSFLSTLIALLLRMACYLMNVLLLGFHFYMLSLTFNGDMYVCMLRLLRNFYGFAASSCVILSFCRFLFIVLYILDERIISL